MQFVIAVAIRYSATGAQFVTTLLVAHQLSPADVGRYLIVYGIVTASYVAAGIGVPDGVVRIAPMKAVKGDQLGANSLINGAASFGYLSSAALSVLVGLLVLILYHSILLLLLSSAWWFAYAVTYVAAQSLVALGHVSLGTLMFYGLANWTTLIAVVGYVSVSPGVSLSGMFAASVAGTVAAAIVGVVAIRMSVPKTLERVSRSELVSALRIGMPLSLGRVAQACLIWSPVWLTGAIFGSNDAASVALGSRLVMSVGAAAAAVRFSIRPRLVALAVEDDWTGIENQGKRVARAATSLCVVALVGDLALGPFLLPRIFGNAYSSLWWIVALLLVGVLAESMAGPTDEALRMSDGSIFVLCAEVCALVPGSAIQLAVGSLTGLAGLLVAYTVTFTALYMVIVAEVERRRSVKPAILPSLFFLPLSGLLGARRTGGSHRQSERPVGL